MGETVTDYYYNEDGRVLEERTDAAVAVQYLWDIRYSDAPVLRWRDADAQSGNGLEEVLYYTQDANWNTTALVDAATGEVVERYLYDPYGKATVLDEGWQPVTNNESAFANTIL